MLITGEILQKINPKTKRAVLDKYVEPINSIADHYGISLTESRMASFLAQISHESGGFNFIKENLNYSAQGLMKTFKKYFLTPEMAAKYERQPQKIANRVYANRMGNGPEESGDGYKFCGRGLIQLTGKHNYTKLAEALDLSIDDCVAYLETPNGATASAGWFWDNNNLNSYCDVYDFVGLTKRINGGTIGLDDRIHLYELAVEAIQE